MKKIIACDVTLVYPNFKKSFEIYMDASLQQLGAVIVQDNHLIAFYSHKLNNAQHNYTTTERELLSIVECFKKFRGILLGQHTTMYTDHKNLVHEMSGMTSEWVLCWHLLLQEIAPDIHYIKRVYNRVTDALSRLNISGECLLLDNLKECYGPTQLDDDLSPLDAATIALKQEKDKGLMRQVKADQNKVHRNTKFELDTIHSVGVLM